MEALFFLLLVAVCHGIPIDAPNSQQQGLQAPDFTRFVREEDPNNITCHVTIHWTEVESGDADDPVIGYKLKVWEVKKINRTTYEKQGDVVVQVVEEIYPPFNFTGIPDGVPKEIVTPANEPTAVIRDMHAEVAYQFVVLAFTAKEEGPLSGPVGLRWRHIIIDNTYKSI